MSKPTEIIRLTADTEAVLARRIEAGVLAGHLLASGERPLPASEAELAALVREGEAAFAEFLLSYVRLVGKLAGAEARRSGVGLADLFQEGFVAMAESLQRFDHRRGRFSTYAIIRVRQHLAEVGAARMGDLALSPGQALQVRRARGLAATLGQERQRTVGAEEVAITLGFSTAKARRLLGYLAPLPVDTIAETLVDKAIPPVEDVVLARQIRGYVARLTPEQASVLRVRYGLDGGEPAPATATAVRLGISLSSVRRLERAALAALRPLLAAPSPPAAGLSRPREQWCAEPPASWPA